MRLPLLGTDPTQIDEEKATKMIRYAIDAGVNYVDTAYPYHGTGLGSAGASEPFVGRVLRDGYRKRVKLATKLPSWLVKSRADMDMYLNTQLERLETDTIDFYLIHGLNKHFWPAMKEAGVADFLAQALKSGKIKHAGFSFHDNAAVFKQIVDDYDWSFCQIQYNYMDEAFQAGKEGLLYAAKKGLGVAIMEPLRGGKIISLPDEANAIVDRSDVKRTPAEWALRWVWNHPEVSVVLSGMTTMEQVVENVTLAADARADSLTSKELAIIEDVKSLLKERIKVDCTACGYCMPCPAQIYIPGCFTSYNDYWMFDKTPAAKATYAFWSLIGAPASKCVECGNCENHCPQSIPIREELKKVVKLFE